MFIDGAIESYTFKGAFSTIIALNVFDDLFICGEKYGRIC